MQWSCYNYTMNDIQPYKFEPEEPSQDEDDSDCLKKKLKENWEH